MRTWRRFPSSILAVVAALAVVSAATSPASAHHCGPSQPLPEFPRHSCRTHTQTWQPGETIDRHPGGARGRDGGARRAAPVDQGLPNSGGACAASATSPQDRYTQGFLAGLGACLSALATGPFMVVEQIWIDGSTYARFAGALTSGDSTTAGRILEIKAGRDRENFDRFVRTLNPNIYGVDAQEAGQRDGSRMCAALPGIVRGMMSRPRVGAGASRRSGSGSGATATAAASTRGLLRDTSWLQRMNPAGSRTNCSNSAVMVDQTLAGRSSMPAMPGPGLNPQTVEMFYGRRFSPRATPIEIEQTMRVRGDLARGIVRADRGAGTPGHQFNIAVDERRVLLLDGQLGRELTWAELRRLGFTEFQLLATN